MYPIGGISMLGGGDGPCRCGGNTGGGMAWCGMYCCGTNGRTSDGRLPHTLRVPPLSMGEILRSLSDNHMFVTGDTVDMRDVDEAEINSDVDT